MIHQRLLLGLCLAVGCSSPQVKPDPSEPSRTTADSREVYLNIYTADLSGGAWQSVAAGSTIKSGTQFSLGVEVPVTSFVFIGQRSANGELTVIHPSPADPGIRVEPGKQLLLPGRGQWFSVDDRTGEESLFLLTQASPDHAAALQLLKDRGDAACVKTRDPPPPDVKVRDRGASVRGIVDDAAVAVLCFPFHHR